MESPWRQTRSTVSYVVLTNVSKESQSAFEPWHSWGYYAVSFEVQTEDGRKFTIFKKPTDFTRNIPSTFVEFTRVVVGGAGRIFSVQSIYLMTKLERLYIQQE